MTMARVAVIGGGIIGSSLSYHLARRGARVTVIAESGAGGVATPATFGWLNASWGNPEPYYHLRIASLKLWRQLGEAMPGLGVSWSGCLTYDLAEPALRDYVAQHRAWGYPVRLVDGAEAARLEPGLREPPALAAFAEAEGAAEPAMAVRALLAASEARLIRAHVAEIVVERGRVAGIRTGEETIAADLVAVAAGAGSPALVATAGAATLKLDTTPGLLLHTAPLEPVLRRIVVGPGMDVRQTLEGRLIIGSDFGGSPITGDPAAIAKDLLETVRRQVRGAENARMERYTIGHRPTPADGFPVIGFVPPVSGLYVAAMHSGMTNAAAVGAWGAEEMLTGRRHPLLAPFGPDRFS
ncbi:MAG TPA: FAD-binding oxidoreductase [Aestuariivirgaceae bacterium]|jgi:glycine/D-amino acid oxidase-like deaminating enzyme|nr:FAD-binding oxidoreductase [Aestuariivirgaceae bacterium]